MECIAEDDLLDLANARGRLGNAPALEAHLADCATCSAVLCTLLGDPEPARDLAGTQLGAYRLDGLIGAGAMGEVYRAWDARLERRVAVKVLSRRFAESPDRVRRLEAEARAAAAIAHANVVTVYDTGSDGGTPYVVSELITGETVRSLLDRGLLPRARALELGLQLVRGLVAAHARGVVHRDLKPANLIVTAEGTLKILDFGLAKLAGDREDAPGTLVGTTGYLAPEQARGEPADARSDLFAAGAILYELLGGRRAFAGVTFAERLSGVLRDTPPALGDPLDPIVMRCLEKDPDRRFQSASDLLWALEGRKRTRAGVSRRTFVLGAAATGLAGGVVGRLLAPGRERAFVPEYRQLTFRHGRVASARFTRDGGSVLYSAAWEDNPTTVFTTRLGGGGVRPLELPPAQLLAVSSRGELALSLGHRFVEGFHQRGQLALAPLEGGEPRGLGLDVQHADFTPAGDELAIVRRVDGRFRLELPAGHVVFEAGWISHPRVSPDGALIACCAHETPADDRGDLVVVPRDGGGATTIARDWTSIDGVAWTTSGRALWISASRVGGNNSVWQVALADGDATLVPSAGRVRVHDAAADGRLAITQCIGRMRLMVKAPGANTEVDLGLSDVSMVTDMSADGRSIVFVEFGDVDIANGAYLRSTPGGPAQRLGDGFPMALADDGRGVLAAVADRELAVYPLPGGPVRRIRVPAIAKLRWARWAGERIVAGGALEGRPLRMWRLDGDSPVAISDEGIAGLGAVSADGRALALVARGRLYVIDVDGRAPVRGVPGDFTDELVCGWDGGEVLVRSRSAPIRVRRVDPATGASTVLFAVAPPPLGARGVDAFVVDGRGDAYAYSYGQELSRLFTMTT